MYARQADRCHHKTLTGPHSRQIPDTSRYATSSCLTEMSGADLRGRDRVCQQTTSVKRKHLRIKYQKHITDVYMTKMRQRTKQSTAINVDKLL